MRVVPNASVRLDTVRNAVHAFISSSYETLFLPSTLEGWQDVPLLHSTLHRIRACESPCPTSPLPIAQAALQVHVYQPNEAESFEEFLSGGGDGGEEEVMAAAVLELPSVLLDGLWDSLIFPGETKQRLLDYIYATVLFSDAGVDCESHVMDMGYDR